MVPKMNAAKFSRKKRQKSLPKGEEKRRHSRFLKNQYAMYQSTCRGKGSPNRAISTTKAQNNGWEPILLQENQLPGFQNESRVVEESQDLQPVSQDELHPITYVKLFERFKPSQHVKEGRSTGQEDQ